MGIDDDINNNNNNNNNTDLNTTTNTPTAYNSITDTEEESMFAMNNLKHRPDHEFFASAEGNVIENTHYIPSNILHIPSIFDPTSSEDTISMLSSNYNPSVIGTGGEAGIGGIGIETGGTMTTKSTEEEEESNNTTIDLE